MKISVTQFAVMVGIAEGATYQEIALQLDCSRHMISHQIQRACVANGCRTSDQLMFRFGHWLATREQPLPRAA
jgi:DNA-binding CsgD family transcriptional regulator